MKLITKLKIGYLGYSLPDYLSTTTDLKDIEEAVYSDSRDASDVNSNPLLSLEQQRYLMNNPRYPHTDLCRLAGQPWFHPDLLVELALITQDKYVANVIHKNPNTLPQTKSLLVLRGFNKFPYN